MPHKSPGEFGQPTWASALKNEEAGLKERSFLHHGGSHDFFHCCVNSVLWNICNKILKDHVLDSKSLKSKTLLPIGA